ncbi:MAG: TAXI family TRAP transporter solute-binding subunit [Gallionella sp.]|nr:TAXI family TRAP transporter solute-binding subunit [Gallionella sp.]MDD4958072.1 TAXI family TRAP transporter solute-binding subunit [Gallionella sp.]
MFGLVLLSVVLGLGAFLFFNSAAPTSLTMLGGEVGSAYRKNAEKYQKILAKQGIKVNIVYSDGSSDNLAKLIDPKVKVDVGFVQGSDLTGVNIGNLVSLGSISYQPLMIFYRGDMKALLSDFEGQRLDIGEAGSGTYSLSLALLKANGIEAGGKTQFVHAPASDLINSLQEDRVDALFLMGDSVSSEVMRTLMHTPDIRLFSFIQADAYTRRIKYLNKLTLPQGSLDFGKNIPDEDTYLVAPTVELIARKNLHPALSDLLLEAAKEVHGGAGLFRKRGEFPAALQHEIPLSEQALNYYQSGKSFLYDTFPFWLASLINRIIAVLVPIVLLLIPGMRIAPVLYRWRIQSRIYPWYSTLLELEREAFSVPLDEKRRDELLHRLNHIEHAVNKIKIPAAFGDLFYGLRGHIVFVRDRLRSSVEPSGCN